MGKFLSTNFLAPHNESKTSGFHGGRLWLLGSALILTSLMQAIQYLDWYSRVGLNHRPSRCHRAALPLSYASIYPFTLQGGLTCRNNLPTGGSISCLSIQPQLQSQPLSTEEASGGSSGSRTHASGFADRRLNPLDYTTMKGAGEI